MKVGTVGDNLTNDFFAFQDSQRRTRLAMMGRPHAVEEMRGDLGASIYSGESLIVGGIGVSDCRDGSGVCYLTDQGQCTR
jgi:hypothetical protein